MAEGYGDEQLALSQRLVEIAATGNLEDAKTLTDQGADAWVQDDDGSTALHAACSKSPSLALSRRLIPIQPSLLHSRKTHEIPSQAQETQN